MNLKVGQVYNIQGTDYTISAVSADGKDFQHIGSSIWWKVSAYTFKLIKDIPMAQDDIPKTLSVMERIKETPDRKTLIKAGYLANGEYTQKAKDAATILFLESQTAKLVEMATEELAEAKID
jgi:hypothetical protein